MCSALASLDPSLRQRFDEPDEPTLDLDDPDVWMMQAVPLLAQAEARTGSETDDELLESARNLQRAFTNANVAGVGTHLEMLEQRC